MFKKISIFILIFVVMVTSLMPSALAFDGTTNDGPLDDDVNFEAMKVLPVLNGYNTQGLIGAVWDDELNRYNYWLYLYYSETGNFKFDYKLNSSGVPSIVVNHINYTNSSWSRGVYFWDRSADQWNFSSSKSYTVAYRWDYDSSSSGDTLIYSSVPIYDATTEDEEDYFFQGPPLTFQEAVERALKMEMKTLGGQMMILTVCGVGCLASLMALIIFGKGLRRYLG